MYANIVVDNKSKYADSFFTYRIPAQLELKKGDRVRVPFGKSEIDGFVLDFFETTDYPDEKIKDIIGLSDKYGLNEEMVETAVWMKTRYAIRYIDAIKCFTPPLAPSKRAKKTNVVCNVNSTYIRPKELTNEQEDAVKLLNRAIENKLNQIFLIHGVTASGKTEVYMEAVEKALSLGKTAIMLVPEISLTNQTIDRFAGRFGRENLAVLHSKLTNRERTNEWERLKSGEAKIAIGARMGVFAPLSNIGVIVMDEEHEATYKADMSPKYDTVEVAAKRIMYDKGILILGSATPSVTSYERAKEGTYRLIELKKRYNETPLPTMEIVDMKEELKKGNNSCFSERMLNAIDDSLSKGKQVILLQNRRGYSNFITCKECGQTIKCNECNISLTYHKSINKMVCHYCAKETEVPKLCPNCKSKYLKYIGSGTEKVEEEISKNFPGAKVGRLDIDTIKDRSELDRILGDFKEHRIDILVGTQLVAKGLDFDNVGLTGVILADVTMNIPDYRSTERTYQLVTQVAGRAGRGDEQGLVIVQTYDPDNMVYRAAKANDYEAFFNQENNIRKFMEYPPFGEIIVTNFTSNSERLCIDLAERFKIYMRNAVKDEYRVFEPKRSYTFKGDEDFRYYVLTKCPKGERNRYIYFIDQFSKKMFDEKVNAVITCDVNPYSIV